MPTLAQRISDLAAAIKTDFNSLDARIAALENAGPTPGVPAFVSKTEVQGNNSNVTSVDLAYPATGIVNGNLAIAAVFTDGNNVPFNTPAGWTKQVQDDSGASSFGIFTKPLDGTEAGNVNFSWTGSEKRTACMLVYENVTWGIVGAVSAPGGSSTTVSAPAITVTTAGGILLSFFNQDTGSAVPAVSIPSGMTQRFVGTASDINQYSAAGAVAEKAITATGTTGAQQWTTTPADNLVALQVYLEAA